MNNNLITSEAFRTVLQEELAKFLQELLSRLSQPPTTPHVQGELANFTFEQARMESTGNIIENGKILLRATGKDMIVNHDSHSGNHALEIPVRDSSGGHNDAARFTQFNAQKDQQLIISLWAKGSGKLLLAFKDINGSSIGGPTEWRDLTSSYKNYRHHLKVPGDYSGANVIKAFFQVNNRDASTAAYVDDVQVKMVENGLRGQYYNGTNFNTLVHTQVDPVIDIRRETGQRPAPSVNTSNYSVRWKGYYLAEENTVSFKVTTDDGVRLWVYPADSANKPAPIINEWRNQSKVSYTSNPQYLEKGKLYKIEYESYNGPGVWVAKLESSLDGGITYKVIPSESLFHDSNACNVTANS
ncbi:PA14 domain-containing protein [Bacillus cereus group sp. BfR-BA-01349]|uniref:PA14 domain-containing protein n=1 Tax=Bacillus cereus group sp. BfR-BA-01349 TaxID=2920312 RepID=UPI001F58AA6B